jgi:hypothetical protein
MKRCVVHIGMHKTGTTSIQQSLDGFEDDAFYYARIVGRANHSVPFFSLFARNAARYARSRSRAEDPEQMAQFAAATEADLARSIAEAGNRTLIISGESIAMIDPEGVKALRDRLHRDFDDIQIVAYVRDPISFMSSAFQQRVRGGSTKALTEQGFYRSYRNSFGKFDHVFGRENVTLRFFDRSELLDGDVVTDFAAWLGIRTPFARKQANESVSRDVVCLQYQYNRYCESQGLRMSGRKTGPVIAAFDNPDAPRFRLAPSFLRSILGAHQEDLAWISARMGRPILKADQSDKSTDIFCEDDLLKPVEGARAFLLKMHEQFGLPQPAEDSSDAALLHKLVLTLSAIAARGNRPELQARGGKKALRQSRRAGRSPDAG